MPVAALAPVLIAVGGLAAVAVGVARSRQPMASDPATYFHELDDPGSEDADEFSKRMSEPFISRAFRPLADSLLKSVNRLTPRGHVEKVHQQLLVAGMSGRVRAEEFVTMQIVATALGVLMATAFIVTVHPAGSKATLAAVLLVGAGALGPYAWLARSVRERKESIFKDLPDVLDLLAISVEAGVGFEGALDVVCTNFTSELALEFSRTLKEMELGLSRREALQNLKRRTEVPELSNFVLAIIQADSLGMPLGRVLHTQAMEMRSQRRQWAREKAGKLPVKILFPLVLFIFPAILVVILGPAFRSIMVGLK